MPTLLIATRNAHKVGEIRAILGADFACLALTEFPGAPEVEEDAGTFAGNATKKAVELAAWLSQSGNEAGAKGIDFVLADDSGLEVDALNGAPGVHSARFAALDTGQPGNSSTPENNAKLMRLLQAVPTAQRTARFRCVLALTAVRGNAVSPQAVAAGTQTEIFDGTCEGRIIEAQRGQGGFGYDPLFVPNGYGQSFAELGDEIKNRLSHRARALARLADWFRSRPAAYNERSR